MTIVRIVTTDELQLLEARWRVREIGESDLHEVADELLTNGEDDDPHILLFSIDRDELRWTGADAFESLLRAWGGGSIGEEEAVGIVLRDIAAGVLAGTITPLEATSRADAINLRFYYQYDALSPWCDLHEELNYRDRSGFSYLGRDQPTVEADVMTLARAVVGGDTQALAAASASCTGSPGTSVTTPTTGSCTSVPSTAVVTEAPRARSRPNSSDARRQESGRRPTPACGDQG